MRILSRRQLNVPSPLLTKFVNDRAITERDTTDAPMRVACVHPHRISRFGRASFHSVARLASGSGGGYYFELRQSRIIVSSVLYSLSGSFVCAYLHLQKAFGTTFGTAFARVPPVRFLSGIFCGAPCFCGYVANLQNHARGHSRDSGRRL